VSAWPCASTDLVVRCSWVEANAGEVVAAALADLPNASTDDHRQEKGEGPYREPLLGGYAVHPAPLSDCFLIP